MAIGFGISNANLSHLLAQHTTNTTTTLHTPTGVTNTTTTTTSTTPPFTIPSNSTKG